MRLKPLLEPEISDKIKTPTKIINDTLAGKRLFLMIFFSKGILTHDFLEFIIFSS